MFLVDASKEMFIKGEDGQPSNFDITMQVMWPLCLVCFAVSLLFGNISSLTLTAEHVWKFNLVIILITTSLSAGIA